MIPHNKPSFCHAEYVAVERVISRGWVAQGLEVKNFENELCCFFGLPDGHALLVSSGSAALYLALVALHGKGKKIGLPVYACAALRNAINLIEGEPVYLDCAPNSPNLDMTAAKQSGLDILIAPSLYGIPIEISGNDNFQIIEDIAQSMGSEVNGHRIGLRGTIGICSFYATKTMTSGGQGGAVISRDKDLIDFLRDYREFDCRIDTKPRFNFQMTDIQAAIGRVQLSKFEAFIKKREAIFRLYQTAGMDLLDGPSTAKPVRYRAVMRNNNPGLVIKSLAEAGISSIVPIEEKELLDDPCRFPQAKVLTKTTVSLPCYPTLDEKDVLRIIDVVKSIQ